MATSTVRSSLLTRFASVSRSAVYNYAKEKGLLAGVVGVGEE